MKPFLFLLLSTFALSTLSCTSTVDILRAKGVRGPNAPVITAEGVRFTLKAPEAALVTIAGSFNGWNHKATEMAKDTNGLWSIVLPLKAGTKYQYKFLVDGFWLADPENPDTVPDGFDGVNSVVALPK